ncbi:MAG: hypothetical protein A2X51_12105 [Candidatus Rokubacteria bacterium GWC2_70_24]|nr:MAG: hypothetical protein A2X53_11880 [Candidatus Rokubacteria bacterium GWA2_70_23]OGK90314.1 MAG: hypothetical protein A2X50_00715 [Candidatus Rokubacteria bacterium GWF2_70_14]OGK93411.1 MAG: hypothetical protein A2X51_12105 [Candidatus Rokubacteria bacterium GWC2_70_24]HAM56761.1 hypothetical protein [Candidatus Rokubacteria bacterium]
MSLETDLLAFFEEHRHRVQHDVGPREIPRGEASHHPRCRPHRPCRIRGVAPQQLEEEDDATAEPRVPALEFPVDQEPRQ